MRYFNEEGIYQGQDLNEELQKEIKTKIIANKWVYIITQEEESHTEVIAEYPNGGKETKIVIDVEQEGYWQYEGDYTADDLNEPFDSIDKNLPYIISEEIGIIRNLTEEEKQAIQDKKDRRDERIEQSQKIQNALNGFVEDFGSDLSIFDNSIIQIYEATNLNANEDSPIVAIYARRIKSGDRTIEDVPLELKEYVEQYIENLGVAELVLGTSACSTDRDKQTFVVKNSKFSLNFRPDDGHTLPPFEEQKEYISVRAIKDDQEIEDFYDNYVIYGNAGKLGVLDITVNDIDRLLIKINCPTERNKND